MIVVSRPARGLVQKGFSIFFFFFTYTYMVKIIWFVLRLAAALKLVSGLYVVLYSLYWREQKSEDWNINSSHSCLYFFQCWFWEFGGISRRYLRAQFSLFSVWCRLISFGYLVFAIENIVYFVFRIINRYCELCILNNISLYIYFCLPMYLCQLNDWALYYYGLHPD